MVEDAVGLDHDLNSWQEEVNSVRTNPRLRYGSVVEAGEDSPKTFLADIHGSHHGDGLQSHRSSRNRNYLPDHAGGLKRWGFAYWIQYRD